MESEGAERFSTDLVEVTKESLDTRGAVHFPGDHHEGHRQTVEGSHLTPHIYEQMTAQIMATDNMNLEHNTMINIDTAAHMNMHYTQD